jgi:anti-sigma regulatory factor (Ser/Thr protein kinase)
VVLWEWGLSALDEQAELIVSELVTNAVQASQSFGQFTPVRFWLLSDREKVLILVWDASPRNPSPADPREEIAEGGRGLMLVEAMSRRWSWYFVHELGGKIVWALCGEASP